MKTGVHVLNGCNIVLCCSKALFTHSHMQDSYNSNLLWQAIVYLSHCVIRNSLGACPQTRDTVIPSTRVRQQLEISRSLTGEHILYSGLLLDSIIIATLHCTTLPRSMTTPRPFPSYHYCIIHSPIHDTIITLARACAHKLRVAISRRLLVCGHKNQSILS